jgi:hypothetical protein
MDPLLVVPLELPVPVELPVLVLPVPDGSDELLRVPFLLHPAKPRTNAADAVATVIFSVLVFMIFPMILLLFLEARFSYSVRSSRRLDPSGNAYA